MRYDRKLGYLPFLLEELKISPSSQTLVFSKTSHQRERISPLTPRAVFFSDQVYVAWIPDSPVVEISCVDPERGAAFYTLDQREGEARSPRFVRCDRCLECHTSANNLGVPGYLVRSVATDETGVVDMNGGISIVNHRTPVSQRWGGWYVSGAPGSPVQPGHLAGLTIPGRPSGRLDDTGELADLPPWFDASRYPQPSSDKVALLVLEHQCYMQTLISRLHDDSDRAIAGGRDIQSLKPLADQVLKYLLFADEAPLDGPARGGSEFATWFENQGPRDHRGRSLRQFDLKTRLFKYPCSYLVYSESFDHLPRPMKLHLYRRLRRILAGDDPDPAFGRIPPETRTAISEILIDTQPGLPLYWTL